MHRILTDDDVVVAGGDVRDGDGHVARLEREVVSKRALCSKTSHNQRSTRVSH